MSRRVEFAGLCGVAFCIGFIAAIIVGAV